MTSTTTTTDDAAAREATAREALERIARLPMRIGEWRAWGRGYIEDVGLDLDAAVGAARRVLGWSAGDAARAHAAAAATEETGPGHGPAPVVPHELTVARKRWESVAVRVLAPPDAAPDHLRGLALAAAEAADDWDDGDVEEASTVVERAGTGEEV